MSYFPAAMWRYKRPMFRKSLKVQIQVMCRSKGYRAAFLAVLCYACVSFLWVLSQSWGMDISRIKDANHLVGYSQMNQLWIFFAILYPFLVVLPFSTSYIEEYQNGLVPAYIIRSSRKTYYLTKLVAAFAGGALVIFLPFAVNLLLCNLFLPHNGNTWLGQYQMGNFYRWLTGTNLLYPVEYREEPFLGLFLCSPFWYNVLYVLLFAAFSGLLGMVVLSLSFWWRKHRILLFLPLFVVMQVLRGWDAWALTDAIRNGNVYTNLDLLDYVVPSFESGRNPVLFLAVVLVCLLVIGLSAVYAIQGDLRDVQ